MDRCPNCGATVRVGAKFCTTCGMRLPEPAATTSTTEETSRSPFDSTSTVASRWPSRSAYSAAESSTTETTEEAPVPSSDESMEASATGDTETPTSPEPSESVSTWGAWTPPPSPAIETEQSAEAEIAETEEPVTWGASEPAQEEVTAEAIRGDEIVGDAVQAEEVVSTGWAKTGETDFLQLPEQPDPAAWKSIENQLAGSGEFEAVTETEDDQIITEAVVDEVEEEAAEAVPAPPSPSIERAFVLLDELRIIIAETSMSAAPAEPVATESRSLEGVRPSEEAVLRFAELRAAADAARDHPRDIDTMLDLSGRLDVIVELHDAFDSLHQAAFGESAETTEDESDQE